LPAGFNPFFTVRFYFLNVFLESVCWVVRFENSLFFDHFAVVDDLHEWMEEMDSVGVHAVESTHAAFPVYHAVFAALAFAVCGIRHAAVRLSSYPWKSFFHLYVPEEVLYCAAAHPV
jgi:hypothetical protein